MRPVSGIFFIFYMPQTQGVSTNMYYSRYKRAPVPSSRLSFRVWVIWCSSRSSTYSPVRPKHQHLTPLRNPNPGRLSFQTFRYVAQITLRLFRLLPSSLGSWQSDPFMPVGNSSEAVPGTNLTGVKLKILPWSEMHRIWHGHMITSTERPVWTVVQLWHWLCGCVCLLSHRSESGNVGEAKITTEMFGTILLHLLDKLMQVARICVVVIAYSIQQCSAKQF